MKSLLFLSLLLLPGPKSALAAAPSNPLGQFDGHTDVGAPKISGSATYNAVSQDYVLSAAGANMWAARDEFHCAWKRMKGDFILQARVEFVGKGVDPHRKLGWIARTDLGADSAYADAAVHGDGLTSLQFRRTKGAITEQAQSTIKAPEFIQFERKGDSFIFSAARFGEPLTSCQVTNLALGDEVYAGLFLCSHNSNVVEKAIFRDVRVIRPAKTNFVPYRDYIGSHLEILDIENGRRQIIHSSPQPFEAPNWTLDGSALIFNGSGRGESRGRLFRFDLATRKAIPINTDFATRNNNDHVLSFDGTMLGISHHSTNHGGRSAIFTVPSDGGTPKLITPLTPSYLHGWSPDGRFLVYTGGRNNEFDIYKISAQGGEEIRLTTSPGLDDGPEFTPDGKHIYFNSSRSGTMQIWRMKPDGSAPEQVTRDDSNNWFPHISPDGRWIAFITFTKEIDPTDHPYYKQTLLRLIPSSGGAPRVLAYVYGGQGTINVPSWSPDSRMLAFVSNSSME